MQKMIVKISPWPSKWFPVQAKYTKNRIAYHEVFESVQQAKRELSFRFYDGILYQIKYTVKGF